MSSFSLGAAIGPVIGGVMLEHFRWNAVFLLGVPVMLMLLVLAPKLLPEFRDPAAQPIDSASAGLLLASVLMVIFGIKRIAQQGLAATSVASIVAGVSVGVLFVRRQRTAPHPLVDIRLFTVPAFSAAFVAYMLSTAVAFGIFVLSTQYMQWVLNLSPLHAGMWIAPFTLAFMLGAQVTPFIARRSQPAWVMTAGLAVAAMGFGMLARVDASSGVPLLVTGMVVFALGLAPVSTLATDLMMGTASEERAGAAAALSETGSELGGALGIAILGSIGTAVYRHAMSRTVLGTSAASMNGARDTLGAALAIAKELPLDVGSELARAAREAFVSSFHVACAVAAFVAIALASAVTLWLNRPNPRAHLIVRHAKMHGLHAKLSIAQRRPRANLFGMTMRHVLVANHIHAFFSAMGKLTATLVARGWSLLPVRLLVGFGMAFHGYAKLHRGVEKFAAILDSIGVPAPGPMAWATTAVELLGGIALFVGLFVGPLSMPLIVIMLTAMFGVHFAYGYSSVALKAFGSGGAEFGPVGYELNLLYIAALLALALSPPTALSLDQLLRRRSKRCGAPAPEAFDTEVTS
jgi:DHA2 family multidrug resistance protein-like MFS transporter